ncbi:MAG TPA: ABC transporter substrate-binding protein [Acidimicrobiia bacterium]|nr:ABC transporter substrate-binding protein [Acidimicrobiia bacterium]
MSKKIRWLALVTVLALVVAACGGDTGGDTTEPADTPDTTTAETMAPETTTATSAPDETTDTTQPAEGGDVTTDVGVTEDTITVGLIADLTGIFAPLVQDIVAAQEVYWDIVNENGGIAGRTVETLVVDNAYDPDQHRTQYEAIRNEVAIISQSTGSPHTSGVIDLMVEDDIVALPLSWYSGWADPAFDQGAALEQQTNYCIEAMNVVEYVSQQLEEENGEPPTWAVVSFPGEYGQDGAFGAKHAIEELGLELVFDGEGLVTPDPADPETEIITGITQNAPDAVFATVNPSNLGVLMGGAAQAGYTGTWTGSVPSYDFRMLDSPVAPVVDSSYVQPGYNVLWNTDVPGMQPLVDAMLAARPDLRPSDAFVLGWLEAVTVERILRDAAESGDMTRAGIKAAALALEGLSFDGLAPDQSYSPPDSPNEFITREIAIFDPDLATYTEAGGANQTIGEAPNGGTTGSLLVQDFFVGDVAAGYEFTERCFAG